MAPEQLAAAITAAAALSGEPWPEPRGTLWRTEGSTRVESFRHAHPGLPGAAAFAAMLRD